MPNRDWDAATAAAYADLPDEPSAAQTGAEHHAGRPPIEWSEPTISGPRKVRIAPGIRYGIPGSARTFAFRLRANSGLYVLDTLGTLHALGVQDGRVVEATIPPEIEPQLRQLLGIS